MLFFLRFLLYLLERAKSDQTGALRFCVANENLAILGTGKPLAQNLKDA